MRVVVHRSNGVRELMSFDTIEQAETRLAELADVLGYVYTHGDL